MTEEKEVIEEVKEETAAAEEPAMTMADLGEELDKSLEKGPETEADLKWEKFEKLLAEKTVFEVKIEEVVKGGVTTTVDEVRAFIPASKLALARVENLEEYKGKKLDVVVITAESAGKKLVLSGRDAALKAQRADRAAAQAAIEVGAELTGTVDSLKDYGAFINLDNGATGLLHVSEISYKRVAKPADVLKVGDKVTVKVTKNDGGKISLSIKALTPAPEKTKREERPERTERRGRREDKVEYTEKEKATTSLADMLSGLKLD